MLLARITEPGESICQLVLNPWDLLHLGFELRFVIYKSKLLTYQLGTRTCFKALCDNERTFAVAFDANGQSAI